MHAMILLLLSTLVPLAWIAGRSLRRRLEARAARRQEADRAEHDRLTSWIPETDEPGAPTLPLLRTSNGLVVMSPQAAGLVAAGRLTSRHNSG